LEDLRVDGRIILKWIFKKWDGSMERIDLARDRDRWQALAHEVMSFQAVSNAGNFLTDFSRTTRLLN
jgi:hypothetical protein